MDEKAAWCAQQAGLQLIDTDHGLVLTDGILDLQADFRSMLPRLKQGRLQHELLVRAARVRGVERPRAVDATAGFGEDSLLLAAAGFEVDLFEHDTVIAALLSDAVARAADDPVLSAVVSRMHVHAGDSLAGMGSLPNSPHVVFLDPMFPGRSKSASVKKKFQLLHHLEQPCQDERALVDAAIGTGAVKIVIKRPVKGPYLAGAKPSYQIAGKAVRYDVLVPPRA